MNSINEKIKEIHNSLHSDYEFPKKNEEKSYYIKYDDSVHEENVLLDYNSNEIAEIRKRLGKLWEKDNIAMPYLSAVSMAMINRELWENSKLGEVDIYNYMM